MSEASPSVPDNTPFLGTEEVKDPAVADPVVTDPAAPVVDPAADEAAKVAADEAAKVAAEKAADVAPEAYADFTVPEGVVLDSSTANEVKAVAKTLNLTQAKAQMLVDKLAPQVAKSQTEAFNARLEGLRAEWATASKTDKEFGGEAFAKNIGGANQVLKEFGTPALSQLLIDSGLDRHPEVIRLLHKVRGAISEDKFISGRPAGGEAKPGFKYSNSPNFK